MRLATLIIAVLDTLVLLFAVGSTFTSGSDPATRGLDHAAGIAVLVMFLLSAGPAFLLVWLNRAPRAALTFALAFPAIAVVGLLVIVATLP